ncbi:hypothetical protein GCM10022252_04910 [Streptosporangium oxazolinicum]|uniref:Integral membrane protein n=1 Tax=Streptosporangium oxazolinicum TaxID=909287 RepID=A0ABP8AB58_9ACTN
MLPVMKIAIGFLFAFAALRFNGLDLLFDPVGWALCVSGLFQLQRSEDDPFGRARPFAMATFCVSLVALVVSGAPSNGLLDFSPVEHGIGVANTACALITVWLSVDAVIRRIRSHGGVSEVALLDVLRWAVVSLGALGMLAGYGYADLGPVLPVVWFAAVLALIVTLYRSAHLPYLSPEWKPVAS